MKVYSYMSNVPTTIRSDVDYREAIEIMHDQGRHHLPVVDQNDQVVGIVTQRDLKVGARHFQEADIEVSRVMHTPVVTIAPGEPLSRAANEMISHRIGGLPVVQDGKVVGVLTETDLFRALIDVLDTP